MVCCIFSLEETSSTTKEVENYKAPYGMVFQFFDEPSNPWVGFLDQSSFFSTV